MFPTASPVKDWMVRVSIANPRLGIHDGLFDVALFVSVVGSVVAAVAVDV